MSIVHRLSEILIEMVVILSYGRYFTLTCWLPLSLSNDII